MACYNPALQSPGLYCIPTADPPCPDGQVCSGNRCVDPRTVRGDLGNITPGDGGNRVDFGSNPRDLASVSTGGCAGIVTCGETCTTSACVDACVNAASQTSQDLYTTALGCGQQYCYDAFECDLDSSQTMLVDPIGAPAGTCNACLNDALSGLFGNSCTSTTNCNPSMCRSSYTACLNNTN